MKAGPHLTILELMALTYETGEPLPAGCAAHLAACMRCRSEADDFRQLRSHVLREIAGPPVGLVSRACALMPPRPPRRREQSRFVLARLIHESGAPGESTAAVRGTAGSRHQLWHVAGVDIDMKIEGREMVAEPMLFGQLLPRTPVSGNPEGNVWLVETGHPPRWAPISVTSEFSLAAPRTTRWTLWLEWNGIRARLRPPR